MIYISSSCRAARTDLPDALSPSVSIVHHSREIFHAIFCIGTELFYIGSSWSCMCSSLLLQQCPACLVCLTWTLFMMGGKWPYTCCFIGCSFQNLMLLMTVMHDLSFKMRICVWIRSDIVFLFLLRLQYILWQHKKTFMYKFDKNEKDQLFNDKSKSSLCKGITRFSFGKKKANFSNKMYIHAK